MALQGGSQDRGTIPDHAETLRSFLQHVEIAISVHGFGRDGFSFWLDPEPEPVIEPYGPAW
jgi:hypothetical protein